MMEKVLKYVPLFSGLLMLLGIIKLTILFNHFNINIISYLTLSDILIAFLNDIKTMAFITFIAVIHGSFSVDLVDWVEGNKLGEIMDYVIVRFKKLYLIIFSLPAFGIILSVYLGWVDLAIWNIYLSAFLISQFIVILFSKQKKDTPQLELELGFPKLFSSLQIVVILGVITFISVLDIKKVESSVQQVDLQLKNGKLIQGDKINKYLGKVGSYHFFSENKKKTTIVKDIDVEIISLNCE